MNLETVYIVRHGIADAYAASGSDYDRRLTEVGIDKTRRAARGMAAIGVSPDLILTSPLLRAAETAEIVAAAVGRPQLRESEALAPGGSFEALVRDFLRPPKPARVLVVGHQPGLGTLASTLLTGQREAAFLPFRKASAACIAVSGAPETLRGTLQWFLAPAQLRALGD